MVNGKLIKICFASCNKGDYYTTEAFEKIAKMSKLQNKNSIDVVAICGKFDEVTKKESKEYKAADCDMHQLSNGNILIYRYDV